VGGADWPGGAKEDVGYAGLTPGRGSCARPLGRGSEPPADGMVAGIAPPAVGGTKGGRGREGMGGCGRGAVAAIGTGKGVVGATRGTVEVEILVGTTAGIAVRTGGAGAGTKGFAAAAAAAGAGVELELGLATTLAAANEEATA
jgi:hypothetical protein